VHRFDKDSITGLSPNVFAFAMTLLVLEIPVPQIARAAPPSALTHALAALWPSFLTYVMSFSMLGGYWVAHRSLLRFVQSVDRVFLWVNLCFLMLIAFLPFAARLVGAYPYRPTALMVYGLTALATLLALSAQWYYATGRLRLVTPNVDAELVRYGKLKLLMPAAICALSIATAPAAPRLSLLLLVLMPLATLWANRSDFAATQHSGT
jgi:uncharacterized membrane protein